MGQKHFPGAQKCLSTINQRGRLKEEAHGRRAGSWAVSFDMLDARPRQALSQLQQCSESTSGAAQVTFLGCSILTVEDSDVESSLTEARWVRHDASGEGQRGHGKDGGEKSAKEEWQTHQLSPHFHFESAAPCWANCIYSALLEEGRAHLSGHDPWREIWLWNCPPDGEVDEELLSAEAFYPCAPHSASLMDPYQKCLWLCPMWNGPSEVLEPNSHAMNTIFSVPIIPTTATFFWYFHQWFYFLLSRNWDFHLNLWYQYGRQASRKMEASRLCFVWTPFPILFIHPHRLFFLLLWLHLATFGAALACIVLGAVQI